LNRVTRLVGLAAGVIGNDLYSVLVVAVVLTTFVAPPWLKTQYGGPANQAKGSVEADPPGLPP
jgi:hypothetical protein